MREAAFVAISSCFKYIFGYMIGTKMDNTGGLATIQTAANNDSNLI